MNQELLNRAGEIKGELVKFAESERFAIEREAYLKEQLGSARVREREAVVAAIDRFTLDWKDSDGRSVVDHFMEARSDVDESERSMLKKWTGALESLFEIDRHEGDAVVALNLVNDLTYRIYSNRGARYTSRMLDGGYIHARIVPVDGEWMLSGSTHVYSSAERERIYRLALQVASGSPAMVFQNPEKLARAWELQKRDHEEFVQYFGGDMVVLRRDEIPAKMRDYMRYKTYESKDSEGFTREERAAQEGRPIPPLPEERSDDYPPGVETVGFVYDATEGQLIFYNMALVVEAFENPASLAEPAVASTVREYIVNPDLSPAPLYRLAARDPETASLVVRTALGLPDFDWSRDSEALLRRYKADYMDQTHLPSVIPISDRLTNPPKRAPLVRAANPGGRKVGRNEPCPCGSGKKFKVCCGR